MWRGASWALVAVLALTLSSQGQPGGDKKGDGQATKIEGEIKQNDPLDANRKNPSKVHEFKLTKGQTVAIQLKSADFVPFLILQDSAKKQLGFYYDDPRRNSDDSKLVFTADKDDTYRIVATSLDGKLGKYVLTIAPASQKEKAMELSRLEHEFNQLQLDFQTVAEQVDMKVNQAKTEAEKQKFINQFYEFAAGHTVKINAFAEAHADDPAGKRATRQVIGFLAELGQMEIPGIGEKLRSLAETAKIKSVRGVALLALAGTLVKQSETAFRKKDKNSYEKLTAEAAGMLEQVVRKYADVQTPEGPLAEVAEETLFFLTKLGVGKTAPEMEGELIDGKKFKLSDFRGKVTVVYFWGSWCSPCRAMIPHERELAQKLEKAPFALVGINSDDNKAEAKAFLQQQKITWSQVWDGGGQKGPLAKAWKVEGWPTVYVLDAKGVIWFRTVGRPGGEFDEIIEQLVAETKK